jgi:LCP family protein required for cell wall assembly
MTSSDGDAPGGERKFHEPEEGTPRLGEPFPGPAADADIPGPRPGFYPRGTEAVPPVFAGTAPLTPDAAAQRAGGRVKHTGARRRTGPAPAQQQLMARISATRKARQQRAVLVFCGALSALVLLASGSAWAVTSWVSGNVGRVDAGTGGTPGSGPLNLLVAGVDVRAGLTSAQQLALHVGHAISDNSDTLMVVHVTADHRSARVVSLPRDSWVNIPGHGMTKINAAFGLGGPKLMVATVEQATGLTINDYIEVNFLGFVRVINALGGVNICLPYAVNDSYSGLNMSAGIHHVNGVTALEFVRDRHSFALSDLARIKDQQQLLSSILKEAISSGTLTDPVKLAGFLSATTAAVTVDQGLNVVKLADEMRGISMNEVTFTTVPIANANYTTPTGQSAVQWDAAAASALFGGLKNDSVATAPRPAARPKLRRSQVSVDIYNGTMIGGLSAGTGTQLAALGFRVHGSGLTWSSLDLTQTVIEYPAGRKAAANLLHKVLPGAGLRQVRGLARIRILLGSAGYQVLTPTPATSSPAGGAQPQTAAQDACR